MRNAQATLNELKLAHIPNEEFTRVTAAREKAILLPAPAPVKPPKLIRTPAGLPPYLASLYDVPLLTREQEVHLFRKMNYLKYKASKLLARLDPKHPNRRLLNRIETLYQQSVEVKNEIIRANLRLVVAMTKRYLRSTLPLFELVSDGNLSLMRAVEKFDYGRGFKFSTYATWAIIKNFAQTIPAEQRYHTRFCTGAEEVFQMTRDERTSQRTEESAQAEREDEVSRFMKRLDPRERRIIRYRYGLERGSEPMTLKAVGSVLGVSKERIRQIQARAFAKLRRA
jgi:RNA polymerase primary sigma factor